MKSQKQNPKNKLRLVTPPRLNALEGLKSGKPKRAKPIDYASSLPASYNKQLQAILTAMATDLKANVLPAIKSVKKEYTADAWPDMIQAMLKAFSFRWVGETLNIQAQRIAGGTVRRIDAENGKAFLDSVNGAVGVEVFGLNTDAVDNQLRVAAMQNAELITQMTSEHVNKIQGIVLDRMRGGYAPSVIAKDLQKQFGMTRRRAKNIARDQTAKLNGELTRARSQDAGLKFFKWSTSKDGRVGDDHDRASKRDVGYGAGIYRWDKPPKEGIPGRAERPNCRCVATPVFEWELSDTH